jgi:hypothetical protein
MKEGSEMKEGVKGKEGRKGVKGKEGRNYLARRHQEAPRPRLRQPPPRRT